VSEKRKEAEMHIKKLHEILPELKEKYHVNYMQFLDPMLGENISREAIWMYLWN